MIVPSQKLHQLFQHSFKQQCVLFHSSKEAVVLGFSCKKSILENFAKFTGKRLCKCLFFNKVASLKPETRNFIKKETLAQVFSRELCGMFENIFFYRTPSMVASGSTQFALMFLLISMLI